MGGGVSTAAAEQMDEMMAYSVLLGRTITCMSFPGNTSCYRFPERGNDRTTLTYIGGSIDMEAAIDLTSRKNNSSLAPNASGVLSGVAHRFACLLFARVC